jgi:hypothetical protein
LHVKKLKEEYGLIEKINSTKMLKEKFENKIILENVSADDIFEIVDDEEIVSKMENKNFGICDICGQDIIFDENPSGLILLNRYFACEECCKDASNKILYSWIETRNAKTEDVKPIAFWLMEKNQRNRLV